MSYELIHTSAPRGLRPGSRGFTTVAMTDGLPPLWRERLESLSAYEAPSQTNELPILHAHLICKVAGTSAHVLSRVGPCGLDYSGRSNRIAHHLLLDDNECPVAGPAWLLQQADLFRKRRDDGPQIFPFGPNVPSGNEAAQVCTAWQQMSGDAGWAGRLIQSLREQPSLPSYIIYAPGTDVLPLVREAIALLPPQERWQVTFSTYFGHLPSDASCAWRCVLAGSAAARGAGRPGVLAIDLTSDLPRAPDSEFTEAARRGRMIAVQAPTPVREMRSAAAIASAGDGVVSAPAPAPVAVLDEGGYGLESVGRVRVARQRTTQVSSGGVDVDVEAAGVARRTRVKSALGWTGWLCAAALAIFVGFISLQNGRAKDSPVASGTRAGESGSSTDPQSQAPTEPDTAIEPLTLDVANDHVTTNLAPAALVEDNTKLKARVAELEKEVQRYRETNSHLEEELADAKEEQDRQKEEAQRRSAAQMPVELKEGANAPPTGVLVASIFAVDEHPRQERLEGRHLTWTLFEADSGNRRVIPSSDENEVVLILEEPPAAGVGDPKKSPLATMSVSSAGDSAAVVSIEGSASGISRSVDPSLVLAASNVWLAVHFRSTPNPVSGKQDETDHDQLVFDLSSGPSSTRPETVHLLPPWQRHNGIWTYDLPQGHRLDITIDIAAMRATVRLVPAEASPDFEQLKELRDQMRRRAKRYEDEDDEGQENQAQARQLREWAKRIDEIRRNSMVEQAISVVSSDVSQVVIYDELGRPWKRLQIRFEAWTPPADEEPKADPRMRPGIGIDVKRSTQ